VDNAERPYEIRVPLDGGKEFRDRGDFKTVGSISGGGRAIGSVLFHIDDPKRIFLVSATSTGKPAAPPSATGGSLASSLTAAAPKPAVAELEKGREQARAAKWDDAMPHVLKAIELYPKFAEAYNDKGMIERRQNHQDDAEKSFRKAIELDPQWMLPYTKLVPLLMDKSNYTEALQFAGAVLKLDPGMGSMHYFSAVAWDGLHKLDDAEKEGLAAEKTDPTHNPYIQLTLGRIYEEMGKTADAVVHYKKFVEQSPGSPDAKQITEHVALLEKK
jgi:tetratricopeptide (TPR) repeat protein